MRYVKHPDYIQFQNEWTAIILFDLSLFAVIVVIPALPRLF